MIETLAARRDFRLKWRFGLRTATLVHRVASRYAASVELAWGRERVDAKDLVALACFRPDLGAPLSLSASGPDADAALAFLVDLFTAGDPAPRCPHADCSATPALTDFHAGFLEYSCSKLHLWTVDRATGRVTSC